MRKTLVFLISLLSFNSFSQTEIKGIVKDQSDSLLLGNVLLLNPIDSSLIRGAHYDYGVFSIPYDEREAVLVKVTSYGFEDYYVSISAEELESVVDLGMIQMELITSDIGPVEVVHKVPLFEPTDNGALRVNVQKTMLASSSTVLEILTKSPNLIVGDNSITVFGKGEALIYMNGKQITFERLNTISVNQVKEIEIITNPSAKYDAQGKAVVNIITVINHSEGVSGVLLQNATQAVNFLSYSAINLNYRKKKLSLSGDYGVTLGRDWIDMTGTRYINTSSGMYTSDYEQEEVSRFANVANYRVGAGYQFNEKHGVSLEYAGSITKFDLDLNGGNSVLSPNNTVQSFETITTGEQLSTNNSGLFNYNWSIDTLGSNLFIGGQFSDYISDRDEFIEERIFQNSTPTNEALRNVIGSNSIRIYTAQVDYRKEFANESTFEVGTKYSSSLSAGLIDFYTKPIVGGAFEIVPGYSNNFEYSENIPAFYAMYGGKFNDKVNYSVGSRVEMTKATGVSNITNETILDTNYLNVFPNASINYRISPDWNLSATYSGRIDRPRYQSLDPFVWYQDSLTSRSGDPFLRPEITNAFEGVVGYKQYSLRFGYNHSINHFRYAILPGVSGENSVVLMPINVEKLHSYFATALIPITVKSWNSFNTISLTFNKVEDSRPEFQFGSISPRLYAYSYNTINVKKWFRLEFMGEYLGSQDDGIYQSKSTYSFTAGVSKGFFKNTLDVTFLANDIFRTFRDAGGYTVGQTTVDYDWRFSTNFYRLSVRFNFGKLRNIVYNNKNTGEDELNRAQ